jgi:glucose dehydrogenase
MSDIKPPRVLGILLAVLGTAMFIGGISIFTMGGGYYFIVSGVCVIVSGILIAMGKLIGAYAYGIALLVMVVWSFIESGTNLQEMLPRIVMPLLIGIHVFSARVRSRLT